MQSDDFNEQSSCLVWVLYFQMQSVGGGLNMNWFLPKCSLTCQELSGQLDVPSPERALAGKMVFSAFPTHTHTARVQFYNIVQDLSGLSEKFHLHGTECLW